ncbi:hypothetical protein SLEP1_g42442 [Rubroshorea leprosula]|uniref:Uncharacterized protein n=1 Tax=Rubroshorea leprosula TaxID=152421 RepID=A0AAV5L9U3_9ROSI|nr:hypothetical protein SLEP1_g42442 [Rubroshorea leprosula]
MEATLNQIIPMNDILTQCLLPQIEILETDGLVVCFPSSSKQMIAKSPSDFDTCRQQNQTTEAAGMGGGSITSPSFTSEEESSEDQDFQNSYKADGEVVFGELDQVGSRFSSSSTLEFEADRRKKYRVYNEILQSYDQLHVRSESLNEAKRKVLSYYPGAWIGNMGCMKLNDYDVPETTTLVLIGPKGCGKSSLVNRISRAIEADKFAPERAQVSYNSSVRDGTCFLQEYMVPRGSTSFCLYDTRSLCDDPTDNIDMITNWMTEGVCHGELVLRKSDVPSLRSMMKCSTQEKNCQSSKIRMVNFVIFVVDGIAVLKSMEGDGTGITKYMQTISTVFNCPYLSFKDDKPVVVVTHGDLLSIADRVWVRVHLGELLGIPPAKQIFDIPGNSDAATELTIVDMLRYSLEHADRNLPLRIVESSYHTFHQEANLCNKSEEEKKTDEGKKQDKESSSQTNHREGNIQNKLGKGKKADKVDIMFGICVLSCVIFGLVVAVFLIKDESESHINCLQNNEVKDSKHIQELARRIEDEDGAKGSHIVLRNMDTNDRGVKWPGCCMEIIGNQSEEEEKAENKNEEYGKVSGENEEYRKVSGKRNHVAAIGLHYASIPEFLGDQERVEGIVELARRIRDEDGAAGSHNVQRNADSIERGAKLPGRAMEKIIIVTQTEEREKAENKNQEYTKISGERNHVAALGLDYASVQKFFGDQKRVEGNLELARRIKDEDGATGSHIVQRNAEMNERGDKLPERAMGKIIIGNQSAEREKAENKHREHTRVSGEENHDAAIGLDFASAQEFFGDQQRVEGIVGLARSIKDEDGATESYIVQTNTDTNERGAELPGRAMEEKITGNQSKEMEKAENMNEEYMKVNGERNHVAVIDLDSASVQEFFGNQKSFGWTAQSVEKKDVGNQMNSKKKMKHKENDCKRDKDKANDYKKKHKSKGKDGDKKKKKKEKMK